MASLSKKEPNIYIFWEKISVFQKVLHRNKKNSSYILHDGPPYANGSIHMGHALNKILKDIIIKYKMLQGFYTPYIPGWDCHGLPIEHQLMQDMKTTKHDVDPVDFRKKAKDFANRFVLKQRDEFCRLGILGDWKNPYLTLNPHYEYGVIKVFYDLVSKGYIHRKLRPISWCGHCSTALADAEIEYKNKTSDAIFVKFKLIQSSCHNINVQMQSKNVFLVAWTTTPWTLPANVGLMIHPDIQYALVHMLQEDEIWIIGQDVISKILIDTLHLQEKQDYIVLEIQGKDIIGSVYERLFPNTGNLSQALCIESLEVSKDEGTGIVHVATGHGLTDYVEGHIKNRLPIVSILSDEGLYSEEVQYENLIHLAVPIPANKAIIQILTEKNLLVHQDTTVHSYPHCWRCTHPILYRSTSQWFLDMENDALRQKLLFHINTLNFIPNHGKNRIYKMVQNRPDWCISRQRIWGTPIPVIYCKDCSKALIDQAFIDSVLHSMQTLGSAFWFDLDIKDVLQRMNISDCPSCHSKNIVKEKDILDVWFDSGSSFQSVLKDYATEWATHHMTYPADLYLEGSDQHRGWFQSSLILSVATGGKAPYKSVLTHGFIVDAEGKKMSKSKKNVIKPEVIVQKYGADILRLIFGSTDYREDIRLSDATIQRSIDCYRKIRNTFRYVMGNLNDFSIEDKVSYHEISLLDQVFLAKLDTLFKKCIESYDQFVFHKLIGMIVEFCAVDCSAIYFDFSKDVLYIEKFDSLKRRSVQTVLYYILRSLIFLLTPIIPFTSEEIWQIGIEKKFWTQESVLLNHKFTYPDVFCNDKYAEYWRIIKALRTQVNLEIEKKKQTGAIKNSMEAHVKLYLDDKNKLRVLEKFKNDLSNIFLVACVEYAYSEKMSISVQSSTFIKCTHCWRYIKTPSSHQDDILCTRCYNILFVHE